MQDKGKVTAAVAKAFAESEFEQYRVIQDQLYMSDFDRLMSDIDGNEDSLKCGAVEPAWRCCASPAVLL